MDEPPIKESSMSHIKPSGLFQVLVVGQGKDDVNQPSLDELKKRLCNTTVDRKAIFQLSAEHPVAIKESVSHEIAQQYIKTLKIIGVTCWVEPMPAEEPELLVQRKSAVQ